MYRETPTSHGSISMHDVFVMYSGHSRSAEQRITEIKAKVQTDTPHVHHLQAAYEHH